MLDVLAVQFTALNFLAPYGDWHHGCRTTAVFLDTLAERGAQLARSSNTAANSRRTITFIGSTDHVEQIKAIHQT
ncbi:MAG: hypothetical protein RIC12_01165 [Pirellulales bacterium]